MIDVSNKKLNSEYVSRMKKFGVADGIMFSATNATNSQLFDEQKAAGTATEENFFMQRSKEIQEGMGFGIKTPKLLRGPNPFVVANFGDYHPLQNCVYVSEMPEHLTKIMLDKSTKAKENQTKEYNAIMRSSLAGKLESEVEVVVGDHFDKLDLEEVKHHFIQHIKNIMGMNVVDLRFDSIWTNFQRPKEYNPVHTHSGVFSFVWYLDIPEVIRQEWKTNATSSPQDGFINFHSERDSSLLTFNPQTSDLLIFNAYQKHHVVPFQSDVTRVSMAGNIAIMMFEDGSEYYSDETRQWAMNMLGGRPPETGEVTKLIREMEK